MNPFTAFTLFGPIIALLGFYVGVDVMFWVGVVVCAVNLFMNLASGAMRFPFLPLVFAWLATFFWSPWTLGVAMGLVLWTLFEGVLEIVWPLFHSKGR